MTRSEAARLMLERIIGEVPPEAAYQIPMLEMSLGPAFLAGADALVEAEILAPD